MIETVGLDADDTLWHNESIFVDYEDRMARIVARYLPDVDFHERLIELERQQRGHFRLRDQGVRAVDDRDRH